MSEPVLGIDHVYLTVRDLDASERFYDRALVGPLEHVKIRAPLAGEPHVHYVNRQFGFTLRPARAGTPAHDAYAPGLHHFCFRVADAAAVDRVANALRAAGIEASVPRNYPEYAPDYYASFFSDPDGIRLEVTNFRAERRERAAHWERWIAARAAK
jgi:catechol 2,3-dioxygenase-like lactoylglutathione lyase family enzyme